MFRVLVPTDGSENSNHAVKFLVRKQAHYAEPLDIFLLNVQHPFPGTVRGVHRQAQEAHQEEGQQALAAARELLDSAGIKYAYDVAVGEVAETIVRCAKDRQIDQIVMATHGRGAIMDMLMGSVTQKVLHLTDVPVLLVK